MKKYLSILVLTLSISSCSWFSSSDEDKVKEEEVRRPVEEIFESGQTLMADGRFQKAILEYQEVQRLYPFSPLANKAKVMEAYANFKDEEYDKAIEIADEFITLNPGNEEVEFVYYMKAMAYYDRITDVKRDQGITVNAQKAFAELTNRFPNGKYARDGQYKLDLIRDHLAAKEMEVGRYYSKTKNYLAAINRYKSVVKEYDDTQQIEEALYRLTEANILLGFDKEALKYSTILGYNYPSSKWYKRSYKLVSGVKAEGKTFVGRVLENFGLGSEPEPTQPVELQSVPNLVDTGGWITDDSSIPAPESVTVTPANVNDATAPQESKPEEKPAQ